MKTRRHCYYKISGNCYNEHCIYMRLYHLCQSAVRWWIYSRARWPSAAVNMAKRSPFTHRTVNIASPTGYTMTTHVPQIILIFWALTQLPNLLPWHVHNLVIHDACSMYKLSLSLSPSSVPRLKVVQVPLVLPHSLLVVFLGPLVLIEAGGCPVAASQTLEGCRWKIVLGVQKAVLAEGGQMRSWR